MSINSTFQAFTIYPAERNTEKERARFINWLESLPDDCVFKSFVCTTLLDYHENSITSDELWTRLGLFDEMPEQDKKKYANTLVMDRRARLAAAYKNLGVSHVG